MSCRTSAYVLIGVLVAALSGCNKATTGPDPAEPGSPAPSGPYFDVRAQLDSVVRALDARHAGAMKRVSVRGEAYEANRVAHLNWADELAIFYQADINKAALRGAYAVRVTHGGPSAGPASAGQDSRYEYTLKPGYPKAPVQYLSIVTYPGRRLRELDATIEQHNALFSGRKTLRLRLDGPGDSSTYQVDGQQKLILFDTLQFHAKSRVL